METRITNGLIEAINGLLQLAKRMAHAFRSFTHFRTMAYLKAAHLKPQLPSLKPPLFSEGAKEIILNLSCYPRETG